jgi:hypothetical protein
MSGIIVPGLTVPHQQASERPADSPNFSTRPPEPKVAK